MTPHARAMELRKLFPGLASSTLDVADIAAHSGQVVTGGLFLACAPRHGSHGSRASRNGLSFLGDALSRGASAVAWEAHGATGAPALPAGVAGLAVPGLTEQLGAIANRFFEAPSQAMAVTGITGTNGKTTVAWLVAQALEKLGRQAGYMGTLGYGPGIRVAPDALTTPDCVTVHRRLRELADGGAGHVAMEVSSHALDQGRVDGVAFRIAAFTNLSRDHLDYHGDLESYGRAKARLFVEGRAATAVINVGDDFGRALAARLPESVRLISVGIAAAARGATVGVLPLASSATGQRLRMVVAGAEHDFTSRLLGAFNVENLAVTAGILHAEGFAAGDIVRVLADCDAPPGRMERVGSAAGPQVVVDFAHTPDALRRALETLRPAVQGQLWCVFGCGGERDAGKRPLMGAIARELADRIVVTDDNPRGEDPEAIVSAVLEGSGRGPAVEVIRDRAAAIRHAVASAARDDLVLVAGKGHESTQTVGSDVRAFSDQVAARRALAERA